VAAVVERGQRDGLIRPEVEPLTVINSIAGALYYYAAVLGERLTDQRIAEVFDLFARGLVVGDAPAPARTRRKATPRKTRGS
jgi:hypothetical protein